MTRKREILSIRYRHLIIGILTVVILFLNGGKELFHNHEHDHRRHDDCPVQLIDQILSSGITIHFDICCEQKAAIVNFDLPELLFTKTLISFIYLRAPPLA